jgi:hypothetical protein
MARYCDALMAKRRISNNQPFSQVANQSSSQLTNQPSSQLTNQSIN